MEYSRIYVYIYTYIYIYILVWCRYIDDIFAIWKYGEDKLKDFMLYINSIHSSFQFTCNYSKECVQFWDVSDSVDNSGNITTDLYTSSSSYTMPLLNRPAHNKATLGDRSFSFASSSVWNSIPNDVRCAPSLSSFKSCLKTYLFCSVYID